MEQLLLVTFFDAPARIGASLRTDARTDGHTDGWTDRRDIGNSILDKQAGGYFTAKYLKVWGF